MEEATALKIAAYGLFVVSLTVHEASHATVAYLGGDRTAYIGGQVSLNPLPHMRREPFGMILLPLIGIFWGAGPIGYATTPVDAIWALRNPRRAALVSLAGPVSNFLLVVLALVVAKILQLNDAIHIGSDGWLRGPGFAEHGAGYTAAVLLRAFIFLNLALGLLNLLPVPPFDGAGIIEGFFPRTIGPVFRRLRTSPTNGLILLIAMLYLAYNYLGAVVRPMMKFAVSLIA